MEKDLVVVGGSAAGITAAKTCRKHFPERSVLLIRKEEKVPIPCGIPYVFGTVVLEDNMISDDTLENDGIEYMVDEVVGINREENTVSTESGKEIGYKKIVLATGSTPNKPPISGIDKENVYTVKKNVPHLENLLDDVNEADNLVIIGGGFIGVELADECRKGRDIDVTIVEILPHVLMLGGFDIEFCEKAEKKLKEDGVNVLTEKKVDSIVGEEGATGVKLSNGEVIDADAVVVAVGTGPEVGLAKDAGLTLGENGGIRVDKLMRTSDMDIFACGDCAEKRSFFTGESTQVMLASIACMEARVAGSNLFECCRKENPGQIAIYSSKVGDLALASAGLSERDAEDMGYNVVVGYASAPNRHPGTMPGMKETEVKLTFNENSNTIIGGQVAGALCGGEMINAIGVCIQSKMTADEIATLQVGTHPALTASPVVYQLSEAAESALEIMD